MILNGKRWSILSFNRCISQFLYSHYIYLCVCVCVCVCVFRCAYGCIFEFHRLHIILSHSFGIHAHTHARAHTHIYICVCVCVSARVCACVFVCIFNGQVNVIQGIFFIKRLLFTKKAYDISFLIAHRKKHDKPTECSCQIEFILLFHSLFYSRNICEKKNISIRSI